MGNIGGCESICYNIYKASRDLGISEEGCRERRCQGKGGKPKEILNRSKLEFSGNLVTLFSSGVLNLCVP